MTTAHDLDRRGFLHVSDPAARIYEALRLETDYKRPSARRRCGCGRFVASGARVCRSCERSAS